MKLSELITAYRPESWNGTRGDTWYEHAMYLLAWDREYMLDLRKFMASVKRWIDTPVVVKDDVVQDGHHRIAVALYLGWMDKDIPVYTSQESHAALCTTEVKSRATRVPTFGPGYAIADWYGITPAGAIPTQPYFITFALDVERKS